MKTPKKCSVCQRPFSAKVKQSSKVQICAARGRPGTERRPMCRECVCIGPWLNSIAVKNGTLVTHAVKVDDETERRRLRKLEDDQAREDESQLTPTDPDYSLPEKRRRKGLR